MQSQLQLLQQHGWEGGKAAMGGYKGEVCATCTGMETGTMMNKMMVNDRCCAAKGLLAPMMRWMHSASVMVMNELVC